jgi:hypothetical protein
MKRIIFVFALFLFYSSCDVCKDRHYPFTEQDLKFFPYQHKQYLFLKDNNNKLTKYEVSVHRDYGEQHYMIKAGCGKTFVEGIDIGFTLPGKTCGIEEGCLGTIFGKRDEYGFTISYSLGDGNIRGSFVHEDTSTAYTFHDQITIEGKNYKNVYEYWIPAYLSLDYPLVDKTSRLFYNGEVGIIKLVYPNGNYLVFEK